MSRVKNNKKLMDSIHVTVNDSFKAVVISVLCDISMSLAQIADELREQKKSEDDLK